jgi:hypothetical protein
MNRKDRGADSADVMTNRAYPHRKGIKIVPYFSEGYGQ